ncbi:MAG: hypothetical protein QXH07_07490 [Thermoplasmata archaeon]
MPKIAGVSGKTNVLFPKAEIDNEEEIKQEGRREASGIKNKYKKLDS